MVHKHAYTLEVFLRLLDYEWNDIFIHVDAKCKDFYFEKYQACVKKSQLFFCEKRISVNWVVFSQVEAELELMKTAVCRGKYGFLHLISGQDLPIKSQKEIHEMFDLGTSNLYMDIETKESCDKKLWESVYRRASVNHFLQEYRNQSGFWVVNRFICFVDKALIAFQYYVLRLDKLKSNGITLAYGANWFSASQDIVEKILQQKDKIKKIFSKASFCDELFMQTIIINNNFPITREKSMRYVDFKRGEGKGHPYVWRIQEFDELYERKELFARKFDENIDKEIIDKIVDMVSNQ